MTGMSVSSLYRPLLILLSVTAVASTLAGCVGFALSDRSILVLPELRADSWVDLLPRSQQNRFMAVWFAHGASYLFGFVAGGVLIFRIWNERHRPRLLGPHDQRGDAKRSIDAAPPMFGEIDDDEDITGEKGLQSVPQLACVSNGAPQSGKETSEAQPMEIKLRPVLLVRERSRDEPTLFWP